jgi:hypothetical protein
MHIRDLSTLLTGLRQTAANRAIILTLVILFFKTHRVGDEDDDS